MAGVSNAAQTRALLAKSWTFQKRNYGSNIALCCAPIFFCVLLAILQVLINNVFLSGDNFKCGCRCDKCCPDWSLMDVPGNYTSDGAGTVTITNPAFMAVMSAILDPSQIISQTTTSLTANICRQLNVGACPENMDFTCLETNADLCGQQYSSASQGQWCAVPRPSSWPPTVQVPDREARAKPWGAFPVAQAPLLVTGGSGAIASVASSTILTSSISENPAAWAAALGGLNTANQTSGNIFNGDMLSLLGMQFGSNASAQYSYYLDLAFIAGNSEGGGDASSLFLLVPNTTCVAKNITTTRPICLPDFVRQFFGPTIDSSLRALLPSCAVEGFGNTTSSALLPLNAIRVLCTELAVIPKTTPEELNDALYCGYNQASCDIRNPYNNDFLGGYDFRNSSTTALDFDFYWNDTTTAEAQGPMRNQRFPGLMSAGVTAWYRAVTGAPAGPNNPLTLLGTMSMPKESSKLRLDFSNILGPIFFTWVVTLLLPTFLQQLVYEKEKRLRMMMKMHGLGDPSYWFVTYLWYLALYIVYIIIFIIIGAVVQLNMFRRTNLGIQIIFYFLHGNCMIAFAFLLSSLFTSARTAIVFAFIYLFGAGLIGELLFKFFMGKNTSWVFFVEWVPAWSLYRGLYEMSEYTFLAVYKDESRAMQFENLSDEGNAMARTWAIFAVEWVLFMVLGWYLEQVLATGTGSRRKPLFFLDCFLKKKATPAAHHQDHHDDRRSSLDARVDVMIGSGAKDGVMADVDAEKKRVDALANYDNTPIVVKNIRKVFPGMDGGKPKMAVRTMTLGIERGECFGLLGPNGAGKTTTIGMLTGFLEPTSGTALVEGFDIRNDMQDIYKIMGVCPQHDLLWEQLTGREHLNFYGRLKGLKGKQLEESVNLALKSVNLVNGGWGDKPCGKYSGGMRRRLSVAVSFIGAPNVVFLDEPSTGLDPASRRNLWDVVKSNKTDRAIILTTHSMEEAEILCDRLGIFVDGQLVCIGSPKEITSRYADFLVFTVTVAGPSQLPSAKQVITSMAPDAVVTYELGCTLKYELPVSQVSLSKVFNTMNLAKANGLQVVDWGVANATLEEVFIRLAKNVGATSKD